MPLLRREEGTSDPYKKGFDQKTIPLRVENGWGTRDPYKTVGMCKRDEREGPGARCHSGHLLKVTFDTSDLVSCRFGSLHVKSSVRLPTLRADTFDGLSGELHKCKVPNHVFGSFR